MLPAVKGDKNTSDKFDENYFNEKLKHIHEFLLYTTSINPSVIPDQLKTEFNKIYEKCGYISSFWDIYGKDDKTICKIDESLWEDNFLLKFVFEDSISYSGTSKTCLLCKICNIQFDANPVYLRYHLNEQNHISKYNNDRNKMKDDLWKNFHTYRHAYENFIEFRRQDKSIHCKICGISFPLSHDDLIGHLCNCQHAENFKDIINFKSNNFGSEQLIDDCSGSGNSNNGNDNNKRKLELQQDSDMVNECKRSKETIDDSCDEGVSNMKCLGDNLVMTDTEALPPDCSTFNKKVNSILEGDQLKLNCEVVPNEKEIIEDGIFIEKENLSDEGNLISCQTQDENISRANVGTSGSISNSSVDKGSQYGNQFVPTIQSAGKLPWYCKKLTRDKIKEILNADIEKHHEFMIELSSKSTVLKFFCQVCGYFEMNSSYYNISIHKNSVKHSLNLSSRALENSKWRYCQFCSAMLFCSIEIYANHYRHQIHLKFVNTSAQKVSSTTGHNVCLTNEIPNSKSKFSFSKYNAMIGKLQLRHLTNTLLRSAQSNSFDQVFGFYCYPCDYITVKNLNCTRHLNTASHRNESKRALNNFFYCDCHINFYCDRDFYDGHMVSGEHSNLVNFFSEGMSVQQSKKFPDPNSSMINIGDVIKEPSVSNLMENNLCKANPSLNKLSDNFFNHNFFLNDSQKNNDDGFIRSESGNSDCNTIGNENNTTEIHELNLETVVKSFGGEKQIKNKVSKKCRARENVKLDEFMSRFCGQSESFKFFCQPCIYFEINSSDSLLSEHENSIEHIHNLESVCFLNCMWRNCQFCCAKLFCSTKLFSLHSRNQVHLKCVSERSLKTLTNTNYENDNRINDLPVGSSSASVKNLSNEEKEIVTKRNEVMKCMVNDIIKKLGKLPKRNVKDFFCFYCCYMTVKDYEWASHMNFHEGNTNLPDYKIFHCNCKITMYCSERDYHQHMSSVEHVTITSFISEALHVQDDESTPKLFESKIYSNTDNNSCILRKLDENNCKTESENDSRNLDTATKKDNGNLFLSGSDNRIQEQNERESVKKDGLNTDLLDDEIFTNRNYRGNQSVSNSEAVSNVEINENSIKFMDVASSDKQTKWMKYRELNSSSVVNYNEFMEKTITKKSDGFKNFCQFCGVLEISSYSAASEHESSKTHCDNVIGISKVRSFHGSLESCSWRQCEFCSVLFLSTFGFFKNHFLHQVHLKMVEDSIKKKRKGVLDYDGIERRYFESSKLNLLMSAVMSKGFKNAERVFGYYCSLCDYNTCKMSKWNNHVISNVHQQKCFRPVFGNNWLPYKTINCGCRIIFLCSDEFYLGHEISVIHTNIVTFFKELLRPPIIKNNDLPLKNDNKRLSNNEDVPEETKDVIFKIDYHKIYWFGLTGLLEASERDICEAFSHFGTVVFVDIFEPNLANICICVSDEATNHQGIFEKDMKVSVNGVDYQIKEKNTLDCKIPDEISSNFSEDITNFLNTLYLNAKEEVHQSVEVSDDLVLKTQIVEDDLKVVLCEVRNVKTIGSRSVGLAQSDSLHDLFVEIDNGSNGGAEHKDIDTLTSKITHIQHKLENTKDSIFKDVKVDSEFVIAEHQSTGLKCRIFCKNSLVVENTNLIRLYANTNEVVKKLILVIKEWIKYTDFSLLISNYTLTWMILYYLMRLKVTMVRPVNLLRKKYNGNRITIAGWDCSFVKDATATVTLRGKQNVYSMIQLLKGFFNFYGHDNIAAYVHCPVTGEMFLKSEFKNSEVPISYFEFPACFTNSSFASYLQNNMYNDKCKVLVVSKGICLQDPLELDKNLTINLQGSALYKFQWLCKKMVDIISDKDDMGSSV